MQMSENPQTMMMNWMQQWMKQNPMQDWIKQDPQNLFSADSSMLKTLKDFGAEIDPAVLNRLQSEYFVELGNLWKDFLSSKLPQFDDRRFSAADWHKQTMHAYNVAIYLLNARFLGLLTEAVQAPEKKKQKIRFAVQQMVDAMSPANFLATNPEAQAKVIETGGESLRQGMSLMLEDIQKGRISLTDESAFEVGRNVATTEGTVVFENRLFQLIQYKPLTKTVHQIPLLMVPPCINKFYILDLQPENSLVRYAVEQGHTVFLVSWANPDQSMSDVTWDNYIEQGAITAIETVQAITKQNKINTFGFCVGGTIVSTALAVLADRGIHPAASLTLLTTLLDFSNTGVLDVFVDELQVSMREQTIGQGGLLPARDLASTFSSLRPNDLVWNYVQSNYLKGQKPPAFDLLYWNSDSTNLPGPMFCWYLRNTYLENSLRVPGKLNVAGSPVDLGKIDAPVFIYGSREDHIVPWQAAFASATILNPKKKSRNRFILGASGHIAGVINPASKNKRNYWVNDKIPADAQAWFDDATDCPGSWWPEWADFLSEHGGKMVKAPIKAGAVGYSEIESAPGRYVKVRAD
jgi:polyhydroxyalkanoate synthase